MKRNYKILVAILCLSVVFFAFNSNAKKDNDPERDKLLLELLTFVIEKGHYSPAAIDDAFSKGVERRISKAFCLIELSY